MSETFAHSNPDQQQMKGLMPLSAASFRGEADRILRPWQNDQGLIDRVPTADEAITYAAGTSLQTPEAMAPVELIDDKTQRSLGGAALRKLGIGREPKDTAVLGQASPNNDAEYVAQPSKEVFGYGNESDRLSTLKKMTFASFKNRLLGMNSTLRARGTDAVKEDSGFTMGGRIAGSRNKIPHIYPDYRDCEDVLAYAFDGAKKAEDAQLAALVLSGGFVASHPFSDGNGRVSRAIYSELSGGFNPDTEVYKQATTSSSLTKDGGSRLINIGTNVTNMDSQLSDLVVDQIYKRTDMTRYNAREADINYAQDPATGNFYGMPAKAYEGLDSQQKIWLEDVYFNLRDVNIDRDGVVEDRGHDTSFKFALSYAVDKFPGFVSKFESGDGAGSNRLVAVDKLLSSGNKDFIAAMADGAREYYKEYAKSFIDMLGAGDVAQKMIEHPGGGKISVRDRIVELSNNFVAEKLGTVRTPLEQRFSEANK